MTFWDWLSINPVWALIFLLVVGWIIVASLTAIFGRKNGEDS